MAALPNPTRMAIASRLTDNMAIASVFSRAILEYGDWRKTFERLEATDKVTAEQVQAAALKYLNRYRRNSVHVTAAAAGGNQ